MNACTKTTTYSEGKWLGQDETVTICDTPGLDTMITNPSEEENMKAFIDNFMEVLQNDIKYVNGIVLMVKGDQGIVKISLGMRVILRLMEAAFGNLFWKNVALVISHWPFSEADVEHRANHGLVNVEYIDEWNDELKKAFSLDHDLKAFFIDSFSQMDFKLNRPDHYKKELNTFQEESSKLWNFVKMNEAFNLLTVKEAYEKINEAHEEINEAHEKINQLKQKVDFCLDKCN